jgi:trimeric autotransporter adhesin
MKTRKTVLTFLGIALAGLTAADVLAQSSFVATYDFAQVTSSSGPTDPTPPPAPPTAAGLLSFGSFTAVGYSPSNPNAGGRFSWTSNPLGGLDGVDDFSQFTNSLNTTAFFEVALTPLTLIAFQIDSISFGVRRSSTGIRNYAVRSSVDGFTSNLAASINPANTNLGVGPANEFRWLIDGPTPTSDQTGSVVTPGATHTDLTSAVTFRFYGWNAEASSGTFSVDNVSFSGSTRNIPEPTTATLLTLGLASLGMYQRRRLKG